MARTFCLTQTQIEILKPKMREVGGVKLASMSGQDRLAFFSDAMGNTTVGKELASSFEQALVSKQQGALKSWAKSVFTDKEKSQKGYTDVVAKIDRLSKEGVLSPTATDQYLENLVATSLGVDLTAAEIEKINKLAADIEAKSQVASTNIFNVPNIEFFLARKAMEDYLNSITPSSRKSVLFGTIGRGNLLASPKSGVVNVISNISGAISETVVRRAMARKLSGVNTELVKDFMTLAFDIYQKTGYDIVRMRQLESSQKTLGESRNNSQGEGVMRKIGRFYEDTVFKQLMGAPDIIFASFHFADSLNILTTKVADAEGLAGDLHKKRARELFLEATKINTTYKEDVNELREAAISDAEYATYQNETIISEFALKARAFVDNLSDYKIGTQVEPFVKTVVNVVVSAYTYAGIKVPYDLVIGLPNAFEEAKKGNPKALQDTTRDLVRAGFGIIVTALLASLIDDEDYMPPYASASKEQREYARLNNAPYNAIRIGDTWVSLDYFGLISTGLSSMLTAKQTESVTEGTYKYFQTAGEQAFRLPVVSKLFALYQFNEENKQYQKTQEEIWGEVGGNIAGNAYARLFPAFIGDIAKGTDSEQRQNDYEKQLDDIAMNIPLVRETLPTKYNNLGEVVPSQGFLKQLFFGARVKDANLGANVESKVVLEELNRLFKEDTSVMAYTGKLQEVKALKEITSFDEYNDTLGQIQADVTIEMADIIDSIAYQRLTDEEKKSKLEDSRKEVVQDTLRAFGYYSRVKQQIKDEKKKEKEGT